MPDQRPDYRLREQIEERLEAAEDRIQEIRDELTHARPVHALEAARHAEAELAATRKLITGDDDQAATTAPHPQGGSS